MASGTPSGAERFAPSCPPEAVRPDGWIGVIGIGSLLSETSARFTSPNLRGFRVVRLSGYRRVFAHTAPVFFHRGIARGREISSLSMEPLSAADDPELAHGDLGLVATYFEIPGDEFPALAAREAEFNLVAAHPAHPDTGKRLPPAVLCAASSDEEYVQRYCVAAEDRNDDACGCVACDLRRHGEPKVWYPLARSTEDDDDAAPAPEIDILPCRTYARHCVLAARSLGADAEASFLDHTFLADRRTTLRTHLESNPDLMEEKPPPELAERYNG
jgi:hypothetical protein